VENIIALAVIAGLVLCAAPVLYLLVLMAAAAFYRRPRPKGRAPLTDEKLVILIPAHNEALTLPACLEGMKQLRGGSEPLVVVVADNCTDDTARLARQAGALVYERHDLAKRGKGYALEYGIGRLLAEYDRSQFDTLVIFDADTLPDPAFLEEVRQGLRGGAKVLQGRYDVLDPRTSRRTRLLYAAFLIYNHIRPLGRTTLGLSDGLRGNGMVFRREVLESLPWQAFSLVEDIEYTNRLARAGLKVTYVPQARFYGQAAATGQQASSASAWARVRGSRRS